VHTIARKGSELWSFISGKGWVPAYVLTHALFGFGTELHVGQTSLEAHADGMSYEFGAFAQSSEKSGSIQPSVLLRCGPSFRQVLWRGLF
jgi:hypothetical protein